MSTEHDPLTAAIIRAGERLASEGWELRDDAQAGAPGPGDMFVWFVHDGVAPLVDPVQSLRIRRETLVAAIRRNEADREALMNEIEALVVAEQRAALEAEGGGT